MIKQKPIKLINFGSYLTVLNKILIKLYAEKETEGDPYKNNLLSVRIQDIEFYMEEYKRLVLNPVKKSGS